MAGAAPRHRDLARRVENHGSRIRWLETHRLDHLGEWQPLHPYLRPGWQSNDSVAHFGVTDFLARFRSDRGRIDLGGVVVFDNSTAIGGALNFIIYEGLPNDYTPRQQQNFTLQEDLYFSTLGWARHGAFVWSGSPSSGTSGLYIVENGPTDTIPDGLAISLSGISFSIDS